MRVAFRSRSGQAIAEFVVGLVAIMCLIGAMLQLGLMCHERSKHMVSATSEAAEKAVADDYFPTPVDYVADWRLGTDRHRHSEDDSVVAGNADGLADTIGRYSLPSQIRRYDDDTPLANADDPALLVEEDALVKGSASRVGMPLLPVVRNWIYRDNSLTIRAEAWSVWARELE